MESVDCAIPPCSICRLLAGRSVEQLGCSHTWHGVSVLFLRTWFLLSSRWDQEPLAEFHFCSAHIWFSFTFTGLGMFQTHQQVNSWRIIPVKQNVLHSFPSLELYRGFGSKETVGLLINWKQLDKNNLTAAVSLWSWGFKYFVSCRPRKIGMQREFVFYQNLLLEHYSY